MSKVNLFPCDSYENVSEVFPNVIASFESLKNIKKGTNVVIKANLVSAMIPSKAATTNPYLLKELCKYLLDKGCKVTIGDSPGGIYNKTYLNKIYKVTQMDQTLANLNDDFSTKKVLFENAKVLKHFEYTAYLDNADVLINFSKLKTHAMMGMSCCVKNLFGTIPGTLKPEYHYRFPKHEDFANMLVDLNEYFQIKINIVDAIEGMEGNGPTAGLPRKIGLILASENPYALDYVCAKIINLKPENVMTIQSSITRNLLNPSEIETNINYEDYIIKNFKNIQTLDSIEFFKSQKIISNIVSKALQTRPKVQTNKCIGCQKCKQVCPMGAITMVNNKPVIDSKKCIKCFCCQEFCPMGAMQVHETFIAKLLHK